MVTCYDCGLQFKSRVKDGEIQVYDPDERVWVDECPSCGSFDFYTEDDEEDYSYSDDYDY